MQGCYVGVNGKLRDETEAAAQRWHVGICSLLVACCLLLVHAADAEVVLPKVLGSHMVVQRSMPVHIWGWGGVGESISVSFRNETKTTTADGAGFWEVYLSPGSAGGPFSLVVRGSNVVTLDDILVGDLWIASGQSNMQMPMGGFSSAAVNNAEKEIAAARYPQIRTMQIAQTSSLYPLDDATVKSPWAKCTPETIRSFSAVGYFFARDVHRAEKVPIGIIDSTWGGTPAEAWTSLPALTSHADMLPFLGAYADMMQGRAKTLRQIEIEKALAERARANGEPAPKHIARRNVLSWQPAGLFNAMIAPLTPLGIKGVIWYQGEANRYSDRAGLYGKLFPLLITDWRQAWGQGDFPFLYVQISSWSPEVAALESVAVVREAQRRTLALRNTAMVVSADIGDPHNVHAGDKQDVGARLTLAARALAYNETVEYSGPAFRQVTRSGSSLRVWFDHAAGLRSKDGQLPDFEIAGDDRKFVSAQARLDGETVIVDSPAVASPQYVRYAWQPNPQMTLQNGAGLPASPFSSDDRYFEEHP